MANTTRKKRLITKGSGQKRQRGNPRKVVSFRPPADLLAFIQAAVDEGNQKGDFLIKLVRLARDCSEEMGVEWWEVERRANVAKVSIGVMLGRLALATLNNEKKK